VPEPPDIAGLLARLGERAPWSGAADWDPVGLQLGDPSAPARNLALCHEVTEAVVGAVEVEPPALLVSYHPLLFRATRHLLAGPGPDGRALRLIRAGTALAVVHTAFDVAPGGASDALADALELSERRGFAPLFGPQSAKGVTFVPAEHADAVLEAVAAAGAATIGNYSHCSFRSEGIGTFFASDATSPALGERGQLNREPEVRLEFVVPAACEAEVAAALVASHPYEEPAYDLYPRRGDAHMIGRVGTPPPGTTLAGLARRVGDALGPDALRVAGDPAQRLARVAVIPGSGSDLLERAAASGAGAIVTGDVSHHAARALLDRGVALVDPGHIATERPGLRRLRQWLEESGLDVRSLLHLDPDPWRARA
jgi:dinuclear metal center YbgI/SA1388 family protein